MDKQDELRKFGMRVKHYRTLRGMTLQELADKTGYTSLSTVGKSERGLYVSALSWTVMDIFFIIWAFLSVLGLLEWTVVDKIKSPYCPHEKKPRPKPGRKRDKRTGRNHEYEKRKETMCRVLHS